MLHKSFKPAKCKTALKMTASRIKLLKNKRDAHVKQLKRELAQLLETGQDQTARIRVEHVVREEKTMAAYDIIDVYCELIVARLPIIESQKNCPIDLKEAISSVIFASPRCADLPELMDVRKHFTAKYGKDFVSAAIELRPECGVSRLLVEKLSAKAPDGPTKTKILSAIAEEHNVKWEPKWFEEKILMPPVDPLNGSTTVEQTYKSPQELQNIQQPSSNVDKGSHNCEVTTRHPKEHDAPTNISGLNSSSSTYSQNFSPTASGADMTMQSGTVHQNMRPGGSRSQGMEFRYSEAGEESGLSPGRQAWRMEFKDATAAAQAAAESAERASMAARAAAELSSRGRMSTQHSMEKQRHPPFRSQDGGIQSDLDLRSEGEHYAKHPSSDSFGTIDSRKHQQEKVDDNEQDDLAGLTERFYNLKNFNTSNQGISSKPSSFPLDDYSSINDLQMPDRNANNSSSQLQKDVLSGRSSPSRQFRESEVESVSKFQNEKLDDGPQFEEDSSHYNNIFSHSHSRSHSHAHSMHSDSQNSDEEAIETPFVFHKGEVQKSFRDSNSHANAAVVFDDSGSDNELINLEGKEEDRDSKYFSSGDGLSSSEMLGSTKIWSPLQKKGNSLGKSNSQSPFASEQQSTVFSEVTSSNALPVKPDVSVSISFDDSEGEDDLDKFTHAENEGVDGVSVKEGVYSTKPLLARSESPRIKASPFTEKEAVGYNRKTGLPYSSRDSDIVEVHSGKKPGTEVSSLGDNISGYSESRISQPSPSPKKSLFNLEDIGNIEKESEISSVKDKIQQDVSLCSEVDTEHVKDSILEAGNELNLGLLTGGLRNKGYKHPPYSRGPQNFSLTKQGEDATTRILQSSSVQKSDISVGDHGQEPLHRRSQKANRHAYSTSSVTNVDSDEDSEEDFLKRTSRTAQESFNKRASNDLNVKSNSRTYFDSDNSDLEDNMPKSTLTTKLQSGSGVSRRTKASASRSDRNTGISIQSESAMATDKAVERKLSSKSTYGTGSQQQPQSQSSNLGWQGRFEPPRSLEQEAPKSSSRSKNSSVPEELSSRSVSSSDKQQGTQSLSQRSNYQGSSRQPRSADTGSSKRGMESKRSLRNEGLESSTRKQTSSLPSTAAPGSGESSKPSSSHSETPSRENSLSKASHVHPKLPDYDTFAAHMLSLRQNRQ